MSDIKKCIRYSLKFSNIADSVPLIMTVLVNVFFVLVIYRVASRCSQPGVYIMFMMFIFPFTSSGIISENSVINQSGLRRFFFCTFRPLSVVLGIMFCWLVYIIPYALIQRNAGAEWFYTASMCLGMSAGMTVMTLYRSIYSVKNVKLKGLSLICLVPFVVLMLVLMNSAAAFKSAVSKISTDGNVIFALAVTLMIISVIFTFVFQRIMYKKFSCPQILKMA